MQPKLTIPKNTYQILVNRHLVFKLKKNKIIIY